MTVAAAKFKMILSPRTRPQHLRKKQHLSRAPHEVTPTTGAASTKPTGSAPDSAAGAEEAAESLWPSCNQ